MDASQVSRINMRSLLFGVFLGLLAVVHSSPAHTATQILNNAEDEVIREAATDGFLVDNPFLPSGAPESPGTNIPASQRPTSDSEGSGAVEGSGGDGPTTSAPLQFETTADSHGLSSAPAAPPAITDDATQSPRSGSTSVANEARPSVAPDHLSASPAADRAVFPFDLLSTEASGSGSGDGPDASTTSGMASGYASSTSVVFLASSGSDEGSGEGYTGTESLPIQPNKLKQETRISVLGASPLNIGKPDSPPEPVKADGSSGWMIITGFIVGLAALVALFVAIATRDKWNGPSQAARLEGNTKASTQQRELETFLHKENPKENGRASEYTVIPLEELPEIFSH